jgi:hypothetical protein
MWPYQLVHDPTRVTSKSVTLIDFIEIFKISVSNYSMLINTWFALIAFTIFYGTTDRIMVTWTVSRNTYLHDFKLFLRDLKNQNFNLVLQITDPDLALDSWFDKFIYTLNKHAPLISKRVRKNKQPKWHKKEFADLRQQRDYYQLLLPYFTEQLTG